MGEPAALLRRAASLLQSGLGVAAASHFSCGQVDDSGSIARFGAAKEGAAARLLHVVGVRGDREQIYHRRSCR